MVLLPRIIMNCGKKLKYMFNSLAMVLIIILWNYAFTYIDFSHNINHMNGLKENWINNQNINRSLRNAEHDDGEWKKILLWTPYFRHGADSWKKIFRRLDEGECEESRCELTFTKSSAADADAIVFNAFNLKKAKWKYPDPMSRSPEQVYVYMTFEAPITLQGAKSSILKNYFNWTMSYRRDADVIAPYGKIHEIKAEPKRLPNFTKSELLSKKRAIWMVSHCKTKSNRDGFVNELQKYMNVDVYGKCGTLQCGQQTTLPLLTPGATDPCDYLFGEYVFYLALENSICTDYVTEKLYRSLQNGIIPLVLGGADYTQFAPPNSYIDSKDFDNVEELAKHLDQVATNVTLYNKYFEWRQHYEIEIGSPYNPFTCDLCKKLHQMKPDRPRKTYPNIAEWQSNSNCYSWTL